MFSVLNLVLNRLKAMKVLAQNKKAFYDYLPQPHPPPSLALLGL